MASCGKMGRVCAPSYALTPSPSAATACDFLKSGSCGRWDGASLGSPSCIVEWLSQEPYQGQGRLHIASQGCGTQSSLQSVDAPFVYQRVTGSEDFVAMVQVVGDSAVQWSQAGLLLTAETGPADRVALLSVQGKRLELTRHTPGGPRQEHLMTETRQQRPWLRVERRGHLLLLWCVVAHTAAAPLSALTAFLLSLACLVQVAAQRC